MFLRISSMIAIAILLLACDSGNNGSSGSNIQKNLVPVLNQSLETTPVVTITLLHQDGSAIIGAPVDVIHEEGLIRVTSGSGTTDTAGIVSMGLKNGSYELQIGRTGEVADYTGTLTVSTEPFQTLTLQTQRHTFSLDSGAILMDETFVSVYQLDSNGMIDQRVRNTGNGPGLAAATDTVAIEMFAGSYRATAYADKDGGGKTPMIKTATITAVAAGTGNTAIDLSVAGFVLTMTLNDSAGAAITAGYDLEAYDTNTFIELDKDTTDGTGVGSLLVGSNMDVAITIYDDNGDIVGLHNFGAISADQNQTLQMHTVSGGVVPSSGTLVADDLAEITIALSGNLALQLDDLAGANIDRKIDMTPTTGVYTVDLFDSAYNFGADDVENLPSVTELAVNVSGADLSSQNISVGPGGIIRGTLLNEANGPIMDTRVNIYPVGVLSDPDLKRVDRDRTDNFGVYAIGVPFGEYDLVVEGAVTRSITVNASNPDQVIDLTLFALTGRITDADNQGVMADVDVLGGDTATSDALGVYSINVMEGINQICFTPVANPVLGYACELNVQVDATTVTKYRN